MQLVTNKFGEVSVVAEENKSGTWSLAAYFVNGKGYRHRRALGTFTTRDEAMDAIRLMWETMKKPEMV